MSTQPDLYNSEDSPHWSSTTIAIVSLILLILFGIAIYAFRIVLTPLIVGAIVAYIFRPVVRFIHQRTRLPYGLASALVYLLLLAILIPTIILLTPSLVMLLQTLRDEIILLVQGINGLSPDATIKFLEFEFNIQDLIREFNTLLSNLARTVASQSFDLIRNVAEITLLTVFTVLISFYLTCDADKVVQWLEGLVPRHYKRDTQLLIREIDQVWKAFFRGQIILSMVVTAILTVVCSLLGLPYPLLLGIWGGMLEFLPSIGNVIWGLTVVLTALFHGSTYLPVSNTTFALIVVIAYVAFAQVDINILIPNIIGKHVRLHPMVVILGVIIGINIGGFLGVALAAPTIASLRIIGRYIYAKLFRMYPFPMVGPPSAPWRERLAMQSEPAASPDASPDDEEASEQQTVNAVES
ncbi:MAG: AI-2E family transporter [Anaerolineae bacterium]|nr:AI-2E family transporter [Anaerolineae bacterium]